jgi:hypothetical protein
MQLPACHGRLKIGICGTPQKREAAIFADLRQVQNQLCAGASFTVCRPGSGGPQKQLLQRQITQCTVVPRQRHHAAKRVRTALVSDPYTFMFASSSYCRQPFHLDRRQIPADADGVARSGDSASLTAKSLTMRSSGQTLPFILSPKNKKPRPVFNWSGLTAGMMPVPSGFALAERSRLPVRWEQVIVPGKSGIGYPVCPTWRRATAGYSFANNRARKTFQSQTGM